MNSHKPTNEQKKNMSHFLLFKLKLYTNKKKVLPGFEPGSLDSKSRVITITLQLNFANI